MLVGQNGVVAYLAKSPESGAAQQTADVDPTLTARRAETVVTGPRTATNKRRPDCSSGGDLCCAAPFLVWAAKAASSRS